MAVRRKASPRKRTPARPEANGSAPRNRSAGAKPSASDGTKAARRPAKRAAPEPARAKSPARASTPKRVASPAPAPAPGAPETPFRIVASEAERVGVVTHFFARPSAAALALDPGAELRAGDMLHLRGHTTDFTQRALRLERQGAPVERARGHDPVALHVERRVRPGDVVWRARARRKEP